MKQCTQRRSNLASIPREFVISRDFEKRGSESACARWESWEFREFIFLAMCITSLQHLFNLRILQRSRFSCLKSNRLFSPVCVSFLDSLSFHEEKKKVREREMSNFLAESNLNLDLKSVDATPLLPSLSFSFSFSSRSSGSSSLRKLLLCIRCIQQLTSSRGFARESVDIPSGYIRWKGK